MTTLIAVYNSGSCVGRCDAKCYDAEHGECGCICGGMNHGAGYKRAHQQTCDLTGERLRSIEAKGGYIPDEIRQLPLFQDQPEERVTR